MFPFQTSKTNGPLTGWKIEWKKKNVYLTPCLINKIVLHYKKVKKLFSYSFFKIDYDFDMNQTVEEFDGTRMILFKIH